MEDFDLVFDDDHRSIIPGDISLSESCDVPPGPSPESLIVQGAPARNSVDDDGDQHLGHEAEVFGENMHSRKRARDDLELLQGPPIKLARPTTPLIFPSVVQT